MANMYKKATAAAEILKAQCTASQAKNQGLSGQLREAKELLKKITEEVLRQPDESVQEWRLNKQNLRPCCWKIGQRHWRNNNTWLRLN